MDANREFFQDIAKTMTDRDLALATLAIAPEDKDRRWKAELYITEMSRRDIRTAMELYREWKKRGGVQI